MPSTTNDVVLYTGEASPNDVRLRHSTFMYAACVGVCSTSAYMKTGDIEVFQVALNTVTGTQDLTYKGFGTPVGALVILTNTTANGAKADHAIIGFGATDGTRFFSCCSHIKHNVATTLSGRRGTETRFLTLVDQDNANLVLADFTSWVTDGLRITLNTAPGQAYIMTVVLFGGAGVTNFHTDVVVTPSVIDTATTVNVGFQPDGLIVAYTGIGWTDGNSTNGGFGLGFVQNTGSEPPAQFTNSHFDVNAVGTTAVIESYFTTYAARDSNNAAWAVEVKNFTATGYDAYTRLFAQAFTVGVIAFKLSGLRAKVMGLTTPASTGAHDDVGIGFLSQFALLSLSSNNRDDLQQFDQDAETIGVSAFTSNVQSCHAITDQDAVSPSVVESVVSLNPISMRRQGALLAEASFTSFSADTLSTNYTAVAVGGLRKMAALFIEQQPVAATSLAAAAFCICSTSAALTTAITMAATTSCICSTSVALTTAITMAAACSGTCSTNLPVLNTAITMAAHPTCICSTSAALTTAITMLAACSGVCSTNLPALTTAITCKATTSGVCSTNLPALTTAITMLASATCVCSTSASLTTAITMASASSCVCSTSAALTTAITCKATTSCVCSTSAALSTQITMAASCSGVCSTSCGLTTAIRCLASATGVCSTSASLTTQITMAAAATGVCSTSCGLTTAITCACSAAGVCSTSASLTTAITMAAAATGVCGTSAALTAGSGIFAGATCVCATSAALSTAITCLSSSSVVCATSAALTTAITMLGTASGFCSTSGSCSTAIQCAVAATGKCSTSASLSTAILCAALTSGHVGCQANLLTAIGLACSSSVYCSTVFGFVTLSTIHAAATGACATSAALRVPFTPTIIVLSATRAYTIPCTTRPLVVDAEARDYLVTAGGPDG